MEDANMKNTKIALSICIIVIGVLVTSLVFANNE
jgi:hypothetical protein